MVSLVTGGAGFIGSHLARAILEREGSVRILDDCSTGRADRVPIDSRVDFRLGSILSARRLEDAMRGVEVCYHLAAIPSVTRSLRDPGSTFEVNAGGTLDVVQVAAAAGVQRIVIASSSSVYGSAPDPIRREDARLEPMSPYAASKAAAEYLLHTVPGRELERVALRLFNVYGPGQSPDGEYAAVIPRFLAAGLAGEPLTIYGTGTATRDFTFVADVVRAFLMAGRLGSPTGTYNVGTGVGTTVAGLAAMAAAITENDRPFRYQPARPGDVSRSVAAAGLIESQLGWRANTALRSGLRSTLDAMRETVPA